MKSFNECLAEQYAAEGFDPQIIRRIYREAQTAWMAQVPNYNQHLLAMQDGKREARDYNRKYKV